MIGLSEAYDLAITEAKKSYQDAEISKCIDIGDRYAFSIRVDGEIIVGAPSFTVDKKTGSVGFLNIPPLENLELLRSGKEIPNNLIDYVYFVDGKVSATQKLPKELEVEYENFKKQYENNIQ